MTYLFDVVFISVPSYSGNSLKMFLAVPVFKQYFLFSSDSIFLLDTTYDWAFAIWMMTFNKSGIYPVPFQDATCMLSSSSCKALPSVFDLGVGETWLTTEADALFCKQLWNCQSLSTSTVFPLQHKSRVNLSHELNPLLLACDYQSSYECSVVQCIFARVLDLCSEIESCRSQMQYIYICKFSATGTHLCIFNYS